MHPELSWGDFWTLCIPPGDKNKINPLVHHLLVHPCFLLASIVTLLRVRAEFALCNAGIWISLKNKHGRKHLLGSIDCDGEYYSLGVSC